MNVRRFVLDHLIGGGEQRFRDRKAERLRCFEVDDQFNFYDLLDRQIRWLLTFENTSGYGLRIDPPVSVPKPNCAKAAATAAPVPLLDPAGPCRSSCGFFV